MTRVFAIRGKNEPLGRRLVLGEPEGRVADGDVEIRIGLATAVDVDVGSVVVVSVAVVFLYNARNATPHHPSLS
jgi:hypothetical protein